MKSKTLIAALTLIAIVTMTLFLAPIGEARGGPRVAVEPLDESAHATVLDRVFQDGAGADDDVSVPLDASTAYASLQSPSGPVPGGAGAPARPIFDPSWRRIDSFGIRETWGYLHPRHRANSPIAFVFDTVVVPPAYQGCLRFYDAVTDVEVRIAPIGGGPPAVIRASATPQERAVVVVVPAALWQNATAGRVLAWTSGADPANDAEAVSDQEFNP